VFLENFDKVLQARPLPLCGPVKVCVQNHVDVYTPHVTKNWETEIVAKRAKNLFGPEGRDVVGTAIDNELESVGTI
jgi:hypothetical protein